MSLVSVIIPYYRKKQYISRALKSVTNQTYKKLEIILIYDDSNKSDLKFIKYISSKDKRIKIFVNKKNLGAGLSRNVGIKKSKGKYIAFLDADDFWYKNKIDHQIKFMIKKGISFSHTSYSIINKQNIIISKRYAKDFLSFKDLIKSCDIGLSTVMIKKSHLFTNKFPNLKTKEDFVLWLKLLSKNVKIYGIDKNLVLWSKIENSLSSSPLQKLVDGFKVYNYYMKFNFLKSFYYLVLLSFNYLKK